MAVIKHEAADLRRHTRTQSPIEVRIEGAPYTVKDWSLGGFRIEDIPVNGMTTGDRLFAHFTFPYHGLEVSFATEIEIMRASDRTLAARFIQLNPREKELLGYALIGKLRNGERANLLETLSRIDIPVSPTQVVPTPLESPPPNAAKQSFRRVLYSLMYWSVGMCLGLTVVVMLYWYFFRLDLEYSVVSLPLYPVISQDVARCQEILVNEGDTVRAGQPLMRVADDVLTRDLELAQLQLATAKVDLQTAEGRVKAESDLLPQYAEITLAKLEMAKGQVEALTAQVEAAKIILARAISLWQNKSSSREAVNLQEVALAGYERDLAFQKGEARIAEQALKSLRQGSYYNSRQLVGDLPQFKINLDDARERHVVAAERFKLAEARAQRLTYYAPFDGKVVKVLKTKDSTMTRGEAVFILEKKGEEPVVDCFVTQEAANSVAVGAKATIWIPSLEKTYHGKIVKVDRTSGFLTEMQAHLKESQLRYNWRGQQDRSAYVQLAFAEDLTSEDWQALAGGMPSIVSVPRTPSLWRRVKAMFQ